MSSKINVPSEHLSSKNTRGQFYDNKRYYFLASVIYLLSACLNTLNADTWTVSVKVLQAKSESNDDASGPDDLYSKITIEPLPPAIAVDGGSSRSFFDGHVDDNNHIFPGFVFTRTISGPPDSQVRITHELWDHDGTSDDDQFDITAASGSNLVATYQPGDSLMQIDGYGSDFRCRSRFSNEDDPGIDGDDHGWIEFSVSTSAIGSLNGDSDQDGFLDSEEMCGIDSDGDGDIDVDLPAMGADPYRKDVFVEIDWFIDDDGTGIPDHSHEPWLLSLINVWNEFDNAPVANPDRPDGTRSPSGIAFHADVGSLYSNYKLDTDNDGIANVQVPVNGFYDVNADGFADIGDLGRMGVGTTVGGNRVCQDSTPAPCTSTSDGEIVTLTAALAANVRENNFRSVREDRFHYSIFAHSIDFRSAMCDSTSGVFGGRYGSNIIVSLAFKAGACESGWSRSNNLTGPSGLPVDGNVNEHTGTFIHEFGHALGLGHGGTDDKNFKPNYFSVMNYHWQLGLVFSTDGDLTPDSLGTDWNNDGIIDGRRFMYSNASLPDLVETNLDESLAIGSSTNSLTRHNCPPASTTRLPFGDQTSLLRGDLPIDWDCDSGIDMGTVSVNVNADWTDLNTNGDADPDEPPIFSVLNGANDYESLNFQGITREEYDRLWGDIKVVQVSTRTNLKTECENTEIMSFNESVFSPGDLVTDQYESMGIPAIVLTDSIREAHIANDSYRNGLPTQSPDNSLLVKSAIGTSAPLVIEFTKPQRRVGLHYGRITEGDSNDDIAYLAAYDNSDQLIGEVRGNIPDYKQGINGFIGLTTLFPDELISKIELRYEGGAIEEPVHVDDVLFCSKTISQPLPEVEVTFGEQTFEITVTSETYELGGREPSGEANHFYFDRVSIPGVSIATSTAQSYTPFISTLNQGETFKLKAPTKHKKSLFCYWKYNESIFFADDQRSIEFNVVEDVTLTAVYGCPKE